MSFGRSICYMSFSSFLYASAIVLIALDGMQLCDSNVLKLPSKSMTVVSTIVITNTQSRICCFDYCLLKFRCKQINLAKYWIKFFELWSYPPDIPIVSMSFFMDSEKVPLIVSKRPSRLKLSSESLMSITTEITSSLVSLRTMISMCILFAYSICSMYFELHTGRKELFFDLMSSHPVMIRQMTTL
jgi:hypothetical protein